MAQLAEQFENIDNSAVGVDPENPNAERVQSAAASMLADIQNIMSSRESIGFDRTAAAGIEAANDITAPIGVHTAAIANQRAQGPAASHTR